MSETIMSFDERVEEILHNNPAMTLNEAIDEATDEFDEMRFEGR